MFRYFYSYSNSANSANSLNLSTLDYNSTTLLESVITETLIFTANLVPLDILIVWVALFCLGAFLDDKLDFDGKFAWLFTTITTLIYCFTIRRKKNK